MTQVCPQCGEAIEPLVDAFWTCRPCNRNWSEDQLERAAQYHQTLNQDIQDCWDEDEHHRAILDGAHGSSSKGRPQPKPKTSSDSSKGRPQPKPKTSSDSTWRAWRHEQDAGEQRGTVHQESGGRANPACPMLYRRGHPCRIDPDVQNAKVSLSEAVRIMLGKFILANTVLT